MLIILALLASILLSSCSQSTKEDPNEKYNTMITIYTNHQEPFFYQMFGNLILEQYPDMELNIISGTSSDTKTIIADIQSHQPDLIISWLDVYQQLRDEDALVDLKPQFEAHKIKLETFSPQMINALQNDNNQLMGISPLVFKSGLFYNKDIFEKYGVPEPTYPITWNQLIQLANSFEGTDINGIDGFTEEQLLYDIARSEGWKLLDEETNELIWNKEQWIKALETVLSSPDTIQNDFGAQFQKGSSAMYYGMLNQINNLTDVDFNWGIVPSPVDERTPDLDSSMGYNDIFSIPKSAVNQEVAFDIIHLLMNEASGTFLQDNDFLGSASTVQAVMKQYHPELDLSLIWQQQLDTRPYLTANMTPEQSTAIYEIVKKSIVEAITQNYSAEEAYELIYNRCMEAFNIYQ